MCCYDEDEEFERDEEVRELPEVRLDEPAPCCVCGKPDCTNACFRCGQPVCYSEDYTGDSECGGWILDWWQNSAYDPDDGNEFYCNRCLAKVNAADDQPVVIEVGDSLGVVVGFPSDDDSLGDVDDCPF
jgi:hypothetical protein